MFFLTDLCANLNTWRKKGSYGCLIIPSSKEPEKNKIPQISCRFRQDLVDPIEPNLRRSRAYVDGLANQDLAKIA